MIVFFFRVVFRKVRALLGGRMRLVLTGGAPLSPDTHEQVKSCLCAIVVQGYGLTESTSCATVMDGNNNNNNFITQTETNNNNFGFLENDLEFGRTGAPTTVCDIRLVDWEEGNYRVTDKPFPRGEILIGGDNISEGYYKLPEKTREEFFDEDSKRWFKTGDIGEVHHDGVLKIIGKS